MMMPVEYDNFLTLLSTGAFDTPLELQPMSKFKWQRLLDFARLEGVEMPVRYALQRSLWPELVPSRERLAITQMYDYRKSVYEKFLNTTKPQTNFTSMVLRLKMNHIYANEIHSIDTSMPTLWLLDIISYGLKEALRGVLSLKTIVMLGLYLRQMGDQVDFIKLENYLSDLGLRKAANLFGTLLVSKFRFSKDEIPFLQKLDKKADKHIAYYCNTAFAAFIDNRHRSLTGNTLAVSHQRNLRRSSNEGLHYARYHRVEAFQHYFTNIFHSIRDIEE